MQPIFISSPPTQSLGYTTLMGVQPLAKDMYVSSMVKMTGLYCYRITGLDSTYKSATLIAGYICY